MMMNSFHPGESSSHPFIKPTPLLASIEGQWVWCSSEECHHLTGAYCTTTAPLPSQPAYLLCQAHQPCPTAPPLPNSLITHVFCYCNQISFFFPSLKLLSHLTCRTTSQIRHCPLIPVVCPHAEPVCTYSHHVTTPIADRYLLHQSCHNRALSPSAVQTANFTAPDSKSLNPLSLSTHLHII